jgi:hypothetical protein
LSGVSLFAEHVFEPRSCRDASHPLKPLVATLAVATADAAAVASKLSGRLR